MLLIHRCTVCMLAGLARVCRGSTYLSRDSGEDCGITRLALAMVLPPRQCAVVGSPSGSVWALWLSRVRRSISWRHQCSAGFSDARSHRRSHGQRVLPPVWGRRYNPLASLAQVGKPHATPCEPHASPVQILCKSRATPMQITYRTNHLQTCMQYRKSTTYHRCDSPACSYRSHACKT